MGWRYPKLIKAMVLNDYDISGGDI